MGFFGMAGADKGLSLHISEVPQIGYPNYQLTIDN